MAEATQPNAVFDVRWVQTLDYEMYARERYDRTVDEPLDERVHVPLQRENAVVVSEVGNVEEERLQKRNGTHH
jgi:hypothetical protein